MNKPIPTSVHAALDYATAAAFVATPHLFGATKVGQRVMYGFAAATVLSSSLTKYELGIWKILPMKAHLALDAASGLLIGASAFMHKQSQSRGVLVGLGLFEIAAALLTQTTSPVEHQAQRRAFVPKPLRALVGAKEHSTRKG
jgi:hypothetical protein